MAESRELISWILQESPGWLRGEIDEVTRSGDRKDAKVAMAVPLHWVYVTAWPPPTAWCNTVTTSMAVTASARRSMR
jgi:murein L,D-transpeptidase YcbB/YkuD